jgi:hypothetical protein
MKTINLKWLVAVILLLVLIAGCIQPETIDLAKVDKVSLIIKDHYTENNINDGKLVYMPFLDKENGILSGDIKNLTINIVLKGLDDSRKYSIVLFNRTYENINYADIDFPDRPEWPEYKKGFVIYYNQVKNYEDYSIGIFVKVILPNGRIVKSSELEPHTFLI